MKLKFSFTKVLLIIFVFIILAMLFSFFSKKKENMETLSVLEKMNDVINDKNHSVQQKISAITSLIPFMDTVSDQVQYNTILNNTTLTQTQQLDEIKKILDDDITTIKSNAMISNINS